MSQNLRSAVIGAVCVIGALLWSAPPAAALSFDTSSDTSLTIDGDMHWFAQRATPLTSGNYQFMAYWDAESPNEGDDAPLKITRRQLSTNALQSVSFDGSYELTDTNDGHNQVALGLSPVDGRIHMSWSTHNDAHQYVQSSAGCMTQATFSNCTWTYSNTTADAAHEANDVTYPQYFSAPDGTLYLTFRYGSSRRGDQYVHRYNNNGTWTSIGRVLHGRDNNGTGVAGDEPGTYNGTGGIPNAIERGPYMLGFKVDRVGRMHVMWTWRENLSGFEESFMQRALFYAYSDDGGTTWRNSAGTAVATAGSDPLKVTDSGLEVSSLPYGWMAFPGDVALDSHNNPHALITASDVNVQPLRDANIRQMHVWRTTNGTWHDDWIEPPGGNTQSIEVGGLMFDRADTAYVIWNDHQLGWDPWNASFSTQDELRWDHVTWQSGDRLHIRQMTNITAIVNHDHIDTPISTSGNKQIRIRMRNNTEGDDFLVWWTTDAATTWTAGKSQTFTNAITANDGATWKTYTFTITDADWTGNLRDLEIDPIVGTTAEAGDEIEIDYIRITDSAGTTAKGWEFNQGAEITMAEASPTNNWATWTTGPLLSGVSAVWSDTNFDIDDQRYADGTGDTKKANFTVQTQGSPGTESLTLREFDILGDTVLKFWNFDVDPQGWTATNHVSGFGWESDGGANSVSGTISGSDSQIMSPDNLGVKVASEKTIQVRLKNTSSATQAAFCFITNADTTWNATKCKVFTITANSGYTEYGVDMTGVAGWASSTVKRVRLDPADNASSGSFKLHRLYIAP